MTNGKNIVIKVDSLKERLCIESILSVVGQKGFINPNLVLRCKKGQMTIGVLKRLQPGSKLIEVPLSVMPALDQFDITYRDGLIRAQTKKMLPASYGALTAAQEECFYSMVQLYNLNQKVEVHCQTAPAIALATYPELLFLLNIDATHYQNKTINEQKLYEFIESRVFLASDQRKRLLPVIDFFDHNSIADGFHVIEEGGAQGVQGVQVNYYPPPPLMKEKHDKLECFVSYQAMDCHMSFCKYGFVDESAFFVRSWPFDMEIEGLRICVSNAQVNGEQYNPDFWTSSDVAAPFYAANHRLLTPGELTIQFMLIPRAEHKNAVEAVLALYLSNVEQVEYRVMGSLNTQENRNRIKRKLIDFNRSYYLKLREYVKTNLKYDRRRVVAVLIKMIKQQLRLIESYESVAFD